MKFTKVRKKPVEVEAIRTSDLISLAKNNWNELPEEIISAYDNGDIVFCDNHILINTLEGRHKSDFNDWVIKGIRGELYPCKPYIFEKTYDLI